MNKSTASYIDSTTEEGCRKLCAIIMHYWHSRGHLGVRATPIARSGTIPISKKRRHREG